MLRVTSSRDSAEGTEPRCAVVLKCINLKRLLVELYNDLALNKA